MVANSWPMLTTESTRAQTWVLHSCFPSPSSPPNPAGMPPVLPPQVPTEHRQALPLFLPREGSSPCLTDSPGIYLQKAQGPRPSRDSVSADPAVWLDSPSHTLSPALAKSREAHVAEDGPAARGSACPERLNRQSRKEKWKRPPKNYC